MTFTDERAFEDAVINLLVEDKGWDGGVLVNPTHEQLLQNWVDIVFRINREKDRLNNVPLNEGEIQQLLTQVNALQTPNHRHDFINAKSILIRRENPEDELHFGKEVSLQLFDKDEIAGGSSVYQIARQPVFKRQDEIYRDRRGDFMLLINGMPLIHVELKKDGVPIDKAIYQIRSYLGEGKYTGLYSLVQLFVAMTPSDMRYFANPGSAEAMNSDHFFYWADFNNEPIGNWEDICSQFLSIPMAHQLIGYYTIADKADGVLKVMRSYQIYATREILDRVRQKQQSSWRIKDQLGGFVWHTTGSGKTLTSYKAAELIAELKYCDKVIFLMDRITLTTQSFDEYKGFAVYQQVNETTSIHELEAKLRSNSDLETLIVTSIQKMSNIVDGKIKNQKDLEKIRDKRIVFIVDEAHRSTHGTMLIEIKQSYPNAMFFGFTGTPILEEDETEISTTDIFGNELHRYSIADGIRDGNVLAFDVIQSATVKDNDLREEVALYKAGVADIQDLLNDDNAHKIYSEYMDEEKVSMTEIEDLVNNSLYGAEHRAIVVDDILKSWIRYNHRNEFSALFTTASIPEAIAYWRLLKHNRLGLKVSALFDASDDFNAFSLDKNRGLKDILEHYNETFGMRFDISNHAGFKEDLTQRLAQKKQYRNLKNEEKIDLVIVVHQLLTGYDSKWINMLFVDKLFERHNVIQAFSRTNRLCGVRKPHGSIKYYRKVHTMKQNIENAIRDYSGNKPFALFVDKLPQNILAMNDTYEDIVKLFTMEGIVDFARLPEEEAALEVFVKSFNALTKRLNAALTQGFRWDTKKYRDEDNNTTVEVAFTEDEYNTLLQRYKEIPRTEEEGGTKKEFDLDYDIIDEKTMIDHAYINSNFGKYLKALHNSETSPKERTELRNTLHKSFASLDKKRQVAANMILNDLDSGDFKVIEGWELHDYINAYAASELDRQVQSIVDFTGVDKDLLSNMLRLKLRRSNIDSFGRLNQLKETQDEDLIQMNLSKLLGRDVMMYVVKIYFDKMIRRFILEDTFYIKDYNIEHADEISAY